MRRVIVIGASGFGKEVAWMIERCNDLEPTFEILGFCDDAVEKQVGLFNSYPLLGQIESVATVFGAVSFICAVGNNKVRQELTRRALSEGHELVTVIDPSAHVAPGAEIGRGCIIGIGSVVSIGSRIGDGSVVNHQVTVGHDVTLGEFSQLCPGVRVSGGCVLGEGALMGSNACTIPGVRVGAWATVGAGSVALRDVPEGGSLIRLGR